MDDNKNGTAQNRTAPKNTQHYSNKIQNTCLCLMMIFIVLVIAGQYLNNDRMLSVGIGIGTATAIIQIVALNLKEDDVYEKGN